MSCNKLAMFLKSLIILMIVLIPGNALSAEANLEKIDRSGFAGQTTVLPVPATDNLLQFTAGAHNKSFHLTANLGF